MGKLIVSEFVTLDGVMEAPGGEPGHPHSGWVFDHIGPEQERYKLAETLDADALLLGRVTYDGFAEAWAPREGEFADKMNAMPKYVVSSTLTDPAWANTTVVGTDVPGAVAEITAKHDGPVLVAGSGTLVHTLLAGGLVDELRLMIFPVAVGGGLRVFPDDGAKVTLALSSTQAFASGVVLQTYERA
jgi:dihydrofolate reductase